MVRWLLVSCLTLLPAAALAAQAPIRVYDRSADQVNLVFDVRGLPREQGIPGDIDDNDMIRIFIYAKPADVQDMKVEIEGSFAGEGYSILASETGIRATTRGAIKGADEAYIDFGNSGPYAAPSLIVHIYKGTTELHKYNIRVGRNYLAAMQLGVLTSDIRFNHYESQVTAAGPETRITNTSDADGELRSFLAVTFYAWRPGHNGHWNGRDLQEQPELLDRINPFIGVGLENFGDEYVIGAAIDLARGFSFHAGWHIAKVDQLDGGFAEGDVFAGPASEIPKTHEWKTKGMLGFSVDLRVAGKILDAIGSGISQ